MSEQALNRYSPRIRAPLAHFTAPSWWLQKLPLATLPICIVFLQGYAIQFWIGLLGNPGWAVSLGLELLHVSFWYQSAATGQWRRFGWGVLAMVATGLLLASAIHEVARPLLQDSVRFQAQTQTRTSLEAEAVVLRMNLVAYREMAAGQGRRGWQDDIRRDTARLSTITKRLSELAGAANSPDLSSTRLILPWLNGVMIWVVIAVVCLFQVGVILAIWKLSGSSRNTELPFRPSVQTSRNNEQTISAVSGISDEPRNDGANISAVCQKPETGFYRELWKRIEAHARNNRESLAQGNGKVTQAALASDLEVNAPDLSAIKLLGLGETVERKPARASVEMLCQKFGLEIPK